MPTAAASRRMVSASAPSSSRMLPRRGHDVRRPLRASGELRRCRHCSAIANTGCFEAIAATSSSVDFGPTPSKKTPTSAFQRAEVGAQDRDLVLVEQLGRHVVRPLPAEQEVEPAAGGTHVADPLGLPPWRHQVCRVSRR